MIPLYSSHTNEKAVVHRGASELQGTSLPRPPPGLCPGPTGGLTATPRPPAEFSNCLKIGNFSFFHIGTGILDYFNAGKLLSEPPPFRTLMTVFVLQFVSPPVLLILSDVGSSSSSSRIQQAPALVDLKRHSYNNQTNV